MIAVALIVVLATVGAVCSLHDSTLETFILDGDDHMEMVVPLTDEVFKAQGNATLTCYADCHDNNCLGWYCANDPKMCSNCPARYNFYFATRKHRYDTWMPCPKKCCINQGSNDKCC